MNLPDFLKSPLVLRGEVSTDYARPSKFRKIHFVGPRKSVAMAKNPVQTSPKPIWDPSISVEKFRPKSPENDDFLRLDPFLGANQHGKWTKKYTDRQTDEYRGIWMEYIHNFGRNAPFFMQNRSKL